MPNDVDKRGFLDLMDDYAYEFAERLKADEPHKNLIRQGVAYGIFYLLNSCERIRKKQSNKLVFHLKN